MASQWYVLHGGKEFGPLTSANLKKLADEGKISPTTSIRAGAEGAWVPASRVQGLFASAGSSAAASSVKAPSAKVPSDNATIPPVKTATPPAKSSAPPAKATAPVNVAPPSATPPPPPPPLVDPLSDFLADIPVAVVPRAVVAPLPKATPLARPADVEAGSIGAKILGAVALILGILALSTCWLPIIDTGLMGWMGIVVGGFGLLLGICGLVAAALRKGSGLALGIAGTSSSVVGLVLTIVLGARFGLFQSAPAPVIVAKAPAPVAPRPKPEPMPVAKEPEPEPRWFDAHDAIEQGDIRARVASIGIQNIAMESMDLSRINRPKPQPMLKIVITIENLAHDKIVQVPGWNGGGDLIGAGVTELLGNSELGKAAQAAAAVAVLKDNFGNPYKQTAALQIAGAGLKLSADPAVRPGQTAQAELIFSPPLETIEFLRLELSPIGFSGVEPLRFEIPKSMITGLP